MLTARLRESGPRRSRDCVIVCYVEADCEHFRDSVKSCFSPAIVRCRGTAGEAPGRTGATLEDLHQTARLLAMSTFASAASPRSAGPVFRIGAHVCTALFRVAIRLYSINRLPVWYRVFDESRLMASNDFDIDSLASYLHLTPFQVRRMVDRGRLPGRKIGGEWRFSEAEIHHWLEAKIGVMEDDDELARMEDVLYSRGPVSSDVSIAELLPLEAITIPLNARTRVRVIERMVEAAAATGWLWDPEKMIEAVEARETLHSTALDNGVALLHPRRPQASILAQPLLALGRTYKGIPFGDSQGRLTDIFFLILSTDDAGHLRTLARLSRFVGEPQFLENLRRARDAVGVHRAIEDHEQAQFG